MEDETIEIVCPVCGCGKSRKIFGSGVAGKCEGGECLNCGSQTYFKWIERNPDYALRDYCPVKCPYCGSNNCKKISSASKIGKVALFGIFAAGTVSKTWHCNTCGSNFG